MIEFKDFLKAASTGNLEIVKQYIEENKNNVNAINKGRDDRDEGHCHRIGDTALMCAACNGYLDIVKVLLSVKGIDINAINSQGYTALMYATDATYYSYCVAPCNPGGIADRHGKKVRTEEMRESYFNIVHALLTKEAIHQIDAVDCNGYTALMHAVSNGFSALVKIILDAGADVTLRCLPPLRQNPSWNREESIGKKAEQMAKDRIQQHSHWQGKMELEDNTILELLKQHPNKYKKALHEITKSIQYIQDNLSTIDPSMLDMLKDPIFAFANLFSTEKQYENLSHLLYRAAADLGHDVPEHIVENFKDVEYKTIDLDKNEKDGLESISRLNQIQSMPIEKIREARLKFFDKFQQNNDKSSPIVNVPDKVNPSRNF